MTETAVDDQKLTGRPGKYFPLKKRASPALQWIPSRNIKMLTGIS